MNWSVIGTTFVAVFLAELGDKTQLAAFSLAAGSGARWAVFLGAAGALVASSAVAVAAGDAVGQLVSPHWLRRLAGLSFVGIGLWFLLRSRAAA